MPNDITVTAVTSYLPDAVEDEDQFAFSYQIRIENRGSDSAQLLNRYWLITDGNGKKQEVRGPGVVGEQPHIAPGEAFEYTSGAVLETPVGTMEGYYEMESATGETFKARIEPFRLAVPTQVN